MCENVNINVSETNETINIVSSEIQEVIDINVFETTEDVTLNITEEIIQVNINKVTSAEQIQSDWNETDVDALDFIKNKPTSTSDFINDGEDGVNPFITAADVTTQVNSDWNATSGVEEILNKPIIPTATSDLTNDGSDGINPFITAADIPPVTGFVPYTGATSNVNLGTHTLSAKDLVINHSSGSGVAASITKGGAGEALTINKTSGSGNAMSVTGGVTQLDELHLTTDLADSYIASAVTWNGKFTLPALTSGSVLFSNGTTIAQDNSNLFWDNTNNRLGIGTATPTTALDILGTNVVVSKIRSSTNTGATIFQGFNDLNNSCEYGIIGSTRAGTGALASGNAYLYGGVDLAVTSLTNIKFGVGSILNERMRIFGATGNIVIQSGGTITDAGFKLDVNGTARVQGAFRVADALGTTNINGAGMLTTRAGGAYFGQTVANSTFRIVSDIHELYNKDNTIQFENTTSNGKIIGTGIKNASAKLQVESTTQGFLPPRMTSTEKNAIATPATGLVVYDTTLGKLCVRGAAAWETITSI
jgi:hypothetical protein